MALLLVAALFGSSVAVAQPGGDADKERARKHFIEGKRLFKQRRYDAALRAFKEAFKHWKHRVIHYNMALVLAFQGKKIAAAVHLRQYLREARGRERELPSILQKVKESVGVLIVQAPRDNAVIYIDGARAGIGRVEQVVEPGERVVAIKVNDVTVARRTLNVPAGQEKVWELASLPTRPIADGGDETVRKGRRRLHYIYFVTAACFTGVSLFAAMGTGVKAKRLNDQFLSTRTDHDLREEGLRYQAATNAFWGLTAAGALATALLAVWTRWKRPERASRTAAAPVITPGPGSCTLTWTY